MVALVLFALNPLICSHDFKLSTSTKDIVGQCMAPNLLNFRLLDTLRKLRGHHLHVAQKNKYYQQTII